MRRVLDAELVLDAQADLGEGPVWDPGTGRLLWVDIDRGTVNWLTPASGHNEALAVGQPVGAVAWRSGGGLVLAMRDGFGLLESGETTVRLAAAVERDNPGSRMNDGACDAHGRFWAGTTSTVGKPHAGTLYRLSATLGVEAVLTGVSMSNGIGWSPDNRSMYYVDSRAQGVDVLDYDLDTGAVSNRRRLVDIDPRIGIPDGLAIDADGCVWLAIWGSAQVHRYTPHGERDRSARVPARQVTSCAFGGPRLDELYVTSAATGLSEQERERQPYAGGIFVLSPGTPGLPPAGYSG